LTKVNGSPEIERPFGGRGNKPKTRSQGEFAGGLETANAIFGAKDHVKRKPAEKARNGRIRKR